MTFTWEILYADIGNFSVDITFTTFTGVHFRSAVTEYQIAAHFYFS